MSAYLQKEWQKMLLNLFGITIFILIVGFGQDLFANPIIKSPESWLEFDRNLASGKWAARFLIISLAMTPLSKFLGWRQGGRLRKPAGLWAFGFAALHVWFVLFDNGAGIGWLTSWPIPLFIWFGLIAGLILTLMAATSYKSAMRLLGKNWKRLHRFVYAAGILVGLHAILALNGSKRVWVGEHEFIKIELNIYLAIILILLLLRLPLVKRLNRSKS